MRAVGDWKVCSKCKVKKRLWDFSNQKDNVDGLRYSCKQCDADYYKSNAANAIVNIQIDGDKRCGRCGVIKDINEFSHNRMTKDGRENRCKPCTKEKHTAYRKRMRDTNPELQKARWREYQQDYYHKNNGWLISKLRNQDRKRDKEQGL